MKKCLVPVLMLLCLALGSTAIAAEFAPLFTVKIVTGTATVQIPGSSAPVPVEAGKAYPYGSTFKTDSGATVEIEFSEGNSARFNGKSLVGINQDSEDGNIKVIHLHSGKIDVALNDGFEANNGFQVLTRGCWIVALKGGSSSFDAKAEGDLKVTVIKVITGELEASGPSYDIPLLTDNNAVSISCSDDRSFVRIRDLDGAYGIEIDDEDDGKRRVEMQKDSVIKILRKPSDVDSNVMIVTILQIDSNGNIVKASTFSTGADTTAQIDDPPLTTDSTTVTGGEDLLAGSGITIASTTSSSSTSTTSTTGTGVLPRPIPRPPVTPPGGN